jgi:hypothetical protein
LSNKRSKKQENDIAKDLEGGFAQPASGAIWCFPNDVCSDNWLVEAKYTEAKSFSIKKSYIRDLVKTALKKGILPAMVIQFDPEGESYAVIRYDDFLELDRYLQLDEYSN